MADEVVTETGLVLNPSPAPAKIVATHQAVAMSAQDMMRAQITVKDFLGAKLVGLDSEIAEVQETYEAAVRHKWKSSTFVGQLQRLRAKRMYYSKLLTACEAGYTIVPNMDCDIFAIRLKRDEPVEWDQSSPREYEHFAPNLRPEEEQRLPVGEGHYENPNTLGKTTHKAIPDAKTGKIMHSYYREATRFCELEFPLTVAQPLIMEATTAAMQMKIFDRIGVVQGRTRTERQAKGDPIVVGQIRLKEGWKYRTATFLLAWYLDPRTL